MPDFETDSERAAYERGCEAARAAASWIIDGNTSREHIERLARMMDDGDPALDQYLPTKPNLSGEWADDVTDHSLAVQLVGPDYYAPQRDAVASAWEQGVSDTFSDECERIVKAALPDPEED